ncbi:MAG TPA: hypothetical protein VMD91_15060 [Candidatus Sulfotelmatobacter sp.]|nr:hypothetical protein [Candidatus Sulfotelmatobacter sp.]
MFADDNELLAMELEISDEGRIRVSLAQECAYCHTPPAPRGLRNPDKLSQWIDDYAGRLGNWSEVSLVTGGGAVRRVIELSDDQRSCLVCDSQLGATIGIPTHILEPLSTQGFSEVQREFLESELVLPICGVCRFSPHALSEDARKIIDRYINVRFGHRGAFEQSDAADVARQIAGLVAREVDIQRRERRLKGS